MIKLTQVKFPLEYMPITDQKLAKIMAKLLRIKPQEILSLEIAKKSLDARITDEIHYVLSLIIKVRDEKAVKLGKNMEIFSPPPPLVIPKISQSENCNPPVVVGMGPCGLFCALVLARAGLNPIVLERGEDVDHRRLRVDDFFEHGHLNADSNVQFGEGGAGTFSDGKLTTGTKNPHNRFVLETFVQHGAPKEILTDSKPHIGTDILCVVIKSIRNEIISLGAQVHFNAKMVGFDSAHGKLACVRYEKDNITHEINTNTAILAIGHSARDTYELLRQKQIFMEKKAFSVGVRIEHLQESINKSLYGRHFDNPHLTPASYKLSTKVDGRGVYSFCMCPGGNVVLSSSEAGGIVTNGMSFHARDSKNANSALLVSVTPDDFPDNDNTPNVPNVLAGVEFQRGIEQRAFAAVKNCYKAPVFLLGDFLEHKISEQLGNVTPSIKPGYTVVPPDAYLPEFVCNALRGAMPAFEKQIKNFSAPDSILTGPETRSSAPVRIVRDKDGTSPSLEGLYPAGEGAGYAGGIMSAASDGIKIALGIIGRL